MRYFVYAPDGQRYGPADVPTIQQWVSEGRLLPTSLMESEISGERCAASTVPGLIFPGQAQPVQDVPQSPWGTPSSPYQNPTAPQSNYYRPGMQMGQQPSPYGAFPNSSDYTTSLVLGIIGAVMLFACGCAGTIISIVLCAIGLVFANKAKAAGHPHAQATYWLNLVVLVLSVLGTIGMALFFGAMGSGGFLG